MKGVLSALFGRLIAAGIIVRFAEREAGLEGPNNGLVRELIAPVGPGAQSAGPG